MDKLIEIKNDPKLLAEKLKELKVKYNSVLQREKKAQTFLNNATDEQLKSWLPEYLKITGQLSTMMLQFEILSERAMTIDETLEGFKIWN